MPIQPELVQRDVIASAREHGLVAKLRMVATNELENLPQTMRVLRKVTEEVGFNRIKCVHDLTRKR
jgi:hypothetical protein